MRDFAYARATDVASTLSALDDGAAIIAGGTELLNWFRLGIADDDRVIDIHDLSELYGISRQGDELRIGALATLNEVGEHSLVNDGAAALGSACRQAASAQLRNRTTLGGNILQRTRCPYFRRTPARVSIVQRHSVTSHRRPVFGAPNEGTLAVMQDSPAAEAGRTRLRARPRRCWRRPLLVLPLILLLLGAPRWTLLGRARIGRRS